MVAASPKLAEILQSIERDRAALLSAVEALEDAQLDFRSDPDSWSVSDVLHHLALSAEANAKLMAMMLKRAHETPPPADLMPEESMLHAIDLVVAGADDRKAQAPERVVPRSYLPAGEALARLRSARAQLFESVDALSPYDLRNLTYPHPLFGELNLYQWLLIGGWHERRHTRQIERIKSSPGFPK